MKLVPLRLGALLVGVVLTAGCAAFECAPPPGALAARSAGAVVSIEPRVVAATTPAASAPPAAPAVRTQVQAPAATVVPAAAVAAVQAPAPPRVQPEGPPPLDLKSLETRLKETKAIGVFSKLALKNQIDDLLERFRAFYQDRIKTTLGELRRSFDMLVMKTLALLQDADPPLAGALASSRESIWGVLSDRAKFSKL